MKNRGSEHTEPDLANLEERIRKAGTKVLASPERDSTAGVHTESGYGGAAARTGTDFIAAVLVCAGLGWLIDKMAGTSPWGILIMLAIGFTVGCFNVWRALNGQGMAVGWRKGKEDSDNGKD